MRDFNTGTTPTELKRNLPSPKILIAKIISIFLAVQSLYGLYESIKFILFDRLSIESDISAHNIDQSSINFYMSRVITTIVSAIGLWFAVHLFGTKSKLSKNLQMIIGLLLIAANTYLMQFFSQLPIMEQFWSMIDFS